MTKKTILIVEDESAIRSMIKMTLTLAGFECLEAEETQAASKQLAAQAPDLVLVDWMLPGASGLEWTRRLKRSPETKQIPIIMLTAKAEENHKVKGLETGADDYIIKPFSPRELVARINAVLRRSGPDAEQEHIQVGALCLEPESHRVRAGETELTMGPTEYRILHFFMSHPDRVYTRSQLLDQVWGHNVYLEERTIDVHIRRLRKVLAPVGCQNMIQTVRGVGYRFSEQPST